MQLGDIVICSKDCEFPNLEGVIVSIIEDVEYLRGNSENGELNFGIDFTPQKNETFHNLNGILPNNTGFFMKEENIKVKDAHFKDPKLNNFAQHKLRGETIKFYRKKKELPQLKENINYIKNDITQYNNYIKEKRKDIRDTLNKIEDFEKKEFDREEIIKNIELMYKKLLKNANIKDIEFRNQEDENPYLIVTTNNLLWKGQEGYKDFDLGAFKIFINMDSNSSRSLQYHIINTEKHLYRRYGHPCTTLTGNVCIGPVIAHEMNKQFQDGNTESVIYSLINFLKDPNYSGPHCCIEDFAKNFSEVQMKPKNPFNYLDIKYWQEHEEDFIKNEDCEE
jgi:hypothetical protein|tara:strand:- start:579 stop:1586 length:1008 start_codon:yes stop_codon:yes gene_type:complete